MTGAGATRYLVIAPQGLGDALEATPIVRALRVSSSRAQIDVAVLRSGPRELFSGLGTYVDRTIELPYWERGVRAFLAAVVRERGVAPYDVAFLTYPAADWKYRALLAAFPARRRFAHLHAKTDPFAPPVPASTLVAVRTAHNVERNRDLLRAAGIATDDADGYLVPDSWKAHGPRRGVTLHVGSVTHDGLAAKRWPLERFIELARRLVKSGESVSVVVGSDEREESQRLRDAVPGVEGFAGSIASVARYLSSRRLTIANDNGIAHLAAGVDTPTIAIFGPTPTLFAPFSKSAVALRPSDCPPCFDVRRPIVRCVLNIDFACLKAVDVELVYGTAARILAETA